MGRDNRTGDLFADSRKTGGASVRPIADASRPSEPRANQSPPLPTRASAAAVGPEECKVIRFPVAVWAPRLWAGKVEIAARTLIERKPVRIEIVEGAANHRRILDTKPKGIALPFRMTFPNGRTRLFSGRIVTTVTEGKALVSVVEIEGTVQRIEVPPSRRECYPLRQHDEGRRFRSLRSFAHRLFLAFAWVF